MISLDTNVLVRTLVQDDPHQTRLAEDLLRSAADFSDHLIGGTSEARGARTTYTFDRALRNQEGFVFLG